MQRVPLLKRKRASLSTGNLWKAFSVLVFCAVAPLEDSLDDDWIATNRISIAHQSL